MDRHTQLVRNCVELEQSTSSEDFSSVVTDESVDQVPKNVSRDMWERFQVLQKRRQTITERSSAKRIKTLQKEVIKKVEGELRQSEIQSDSQRLTDKGETATIDSPQTRESVSIHVPEAQASSSATERWLEVKPFLTANDHLKGIDRGKYAPKSKLEKILDAAIELGDMDTADVISDKLATREFGKKIADAFDAKRYAEAKKQEEDLKKEKKKKKLKWGFQHKERWEMKGNM